MGLAALQRESSTGVLAAGELLRSFSETTSTQMRFVAHNIKTIEVESGATAQLIVTLQEIAELIDRSPAEVAGSTVIVSDLAAGEETSFVLGEQDLVLEVTPGRDSTLFRIDVDLSTAAGSFPADVADWIVRPAMRVVQVKAGEPTLAFLAGPQTMLSGGAASLSVQLFDAEGQLVKKAYSARFVDAEGNEVGRAEQEYGTAVFQFIPRPSDPVVQGVDRRLLSKADDEFPGLGIIGTAFSKDAVVTVNDQIVSSEDMSVVSPEEILVIVDIPGTVSVTVMNPGGVTSEPHILNE